jgi:DNA-binding response OmpR family regulator
MQKIEGKVLLVEDSSAMQIMVKTVIADLCELHCVGTISEAEKALAKEDYSLILLDVSLPDGNGFEFCKQLRAQSDNNIPIIFLTGETEIEQRVLGLELGADDYVTKPIEPQEFVARVLNKLRKAKAMPAVFRKSDFKVNLNAQKAFIITSDGHEELLPLTPIEFKLLVQFLKNEGTVFSREELLQTVWGDTVHVSEHTVDTHISSLRKKMGSFGSCLRAVMKRGYYFSIPKQDSEK